MTLSKIVSILEPSTAVDLSKDCFAIGIGVLFCDDVRAVFSQTISREFHSVLSTLNELRTHLDFVYDDGATNLLPSNFLKEMGKKELEGVGFNLNNNTCNLMIPMKLRDTRISIRKDTTEASLIIRVQNVDDRKSHIFEATILNGTYEVFDVVKNDEAPHKIDSFYHSSKDFNSWKDVIKERLRTYVSANYDQVKFFKYIQA
jgi:hypothetical protein